MLYFKDSVDEFVVKVLGEYDGKKFRNIQDGDLELNSEEEKAAVSEKKSSTKSFQIISRKNWGIRFRPCALRTSW